MSEDRSRNESGQYDDRLPPETVLDVFDRREDRARPVTAGDVVDALDVSRRTALNKLNELVAGGSLESRSVGARARVFWRPIPADADERVKRLSDELGEPLTVGQTVYEDGDSHPLDAPDAPESGRERDPERRESSESTVAADAPDGSSDARERSESTPGASSTIDGLGLDPDRRDAVRAMYEHLREYETARKSDFTGEVYPEHPAGYGSADGWWNALGTGSTTADSKGALADVDGVEKPPSGRPTWKYVGD